MQKLFIILFVACWSAVAGAAEQRFPTPDFESGYRLPVTETPRPRSDFLEYLDVAVLFGALALAAWLAVRRRSRKGIFTLMLFCLAYFGFWRKGCVCPIGAIQNMTSVFVDAEYAVPLTVVAFFFVPLVFALLFGRVFCAAVCPLGAVQDAVVLRPVKVPRALAQALSLVPHIVLGLAILLVVNNGAYMICRLDPFVGFFRLSGAFAMLLAGGIVLAIGTVVARPYCRFFCPYAVLLGWASTVSRRHLTITPDECINCRLCEDACPFDAILPASRDQRPADLRIGSRAAFHALMLPALVAVFAVAGGWMGRPLSNTNRTVRLARQIAAEDSGAAVEVTDASRAFRQGGQASGQLFDEERSIRRRFVAGGRWLGGYIGLVIGLKMVVLSGRRRREGYEPDRARCLSCGRCIDYCPVERAKRGGVKRA